MAEWGLEVVYLQDVALFTSTFLGGGFNYVFFHLYLRKIPILTNIFSNGLQPPTTFLLDQRFLP